MLKKGIERLRIKYCWKVFKNSFLASTEISWYAKKQFCQREAVVAQLVEHVLGKDEVIGSIPINGSSVMLSLASKSDKDVKNRLEPGRGRETGVSSLG